jgi:hypothetical protein
MSDHTALITLIVLISLQLICSLFFIFERPLRWLFFKISDWRFERRTGIKMPPQGGARSQ